MSLSKHHGELSLHLVDAVAGDAFFIVFPSSCLRHGGFLDKPKFLSQFLHEVPFPGFGIKVYHMPCAGGYLLGRCVCATEWTKVQAQGLGLQTSVSQRT